MDWQQVIALGIVGITAAIFLVVRLRRKKPGLGCGQGCGCPLPMPTNAPPRIIFRARKGERSQVIVKAPATRSASLPNAGR